jgi:DNA polymerase/3'-5' exonuclease PolX
MSNEETNPAFIKPVVSGCPFDVAHELAFNILNTLVPHCEKIHIAGSVRRRKAFVKDIEIVCQAKEMALKDMFGWYEGVIVDLQFQKSVKNLGEIVKGKTDGKYMQIKLPEGINLDLFMPDANDYFRQYAIRTGSAEYSHTVIARGWLKLGWVGTEEGLRRIEDCQQVANGSGKSKWKIVNKNGNRPPVWKSEEEFFEWLNVKWIEPEARTL